MNYIVLLKQVPDIAHIPADAWNHETGTLKRALLDNVMNPYDLHALSCACRMRDAAGAGRVLCLTMGIRAAADMLADAMSRGADEGVLLTDAAFAGADTAATAVALALAVRKIVRERFDGDDQYLILAGMQSVDGDTAQVPGQVSEALGIDLVAYVCGIDYKKPRLFKRIASSGVQTVEVGRLPAVLTLTDCTLPLYPSFARARMMRSNPSALTIWSVADVNADLSKVGAKGSWTQVVRIFSPLEKGRHCRLAAGHEELVELIDDLLKRAAVAASAQPEPDPKPATPAYSGDVFVYAERSDGRLAPVVYELLGQARRLADTLDCRVAAVLAAGDVAAMPAELIACGADDVYLVGDCRLDADDGMAVCSAVADVVNARHPQIMLFGATPHGRQIAPRIAYATASGLTADCTHLAVGAHAGKEGVLLQTRPALGGNIMATIISKSCRTQMATVRPGVLPPATPDPARTGTVIERRCAVRRGNVRLVAAEAPLQKTGLVDAEIIVAGGAGLHSKTNFDRLLQPLAEAMARRFSLKSAVGASRRAVEHSYAVRPMQVGQTGQTVSPSVYFAVGISGAVQHISAIQRSKVIVAVNPDHKAPIFRTADAGIVGKAEHVIPRIIEALNAKTHGR
ncbi:MAG TPA: FAD-binding protein [Sedimentisphaerales bacterium]|nr:FAD-binding protein [Sedimentisphaerales bacterium]